VPEDVIQLPPDSSGKQLRTATITRADGTAAHQERPALAEPSGRTVELLEVADLLREILAELRTTRLVICETFDQPYWPTANYDLNTERGD